jgi:ABC-type antimicrobial peptide transport system permease subunit
MTEIVGSVDPRLPVFDVQPLAAFVSRSIARERFALSAIGAFGVVGLLLALVGLYATIARAVRHRMQEFGIRRALGASDRHITSIVMTDGILLALAGSGAGVVLALGAVQSVRHLLFLVSPLDPATWIGVAFVVAGATVAASWLPARKARSAAPMAALREE